MCPRSHPKVEIKAKIRKFHKIALSIIFHNFQKKLPLNASFLRVKYLRFKYSKNVKSFQEIFHSDFSLYTFGLLMGLTDTPVE